MTDIGCQRTDVRGPKTTPARVFRPLRLTSVSSRVRCWSSALGLDRDGPARAACRRLLAPHGEVRAAHGAGREFSNRGAASLEPRKTQLASSLRHAGRPSHRGDSDGRSGCIALVRGSRLGRSELGASPRRLSRGRAPHHEGLGALHERRVGPLVSVLSLHSELLVSYQVLGRAHRIQEFKITGDLCDAEPISRFVCLRMGHVTDISF